MIIQKQEEPGKKLTKAELAKKIDAMRERDMELVTGIFRYIEKPNQKLQFNYHKYEGDGNPRYELVDGQRYRLPRMVARHLNQNCYYVEYQRMAARLGGDQGVMMAGTGNEDTQAQMYGVKKIHRTEFRSLEFMDEDLYPEVNQIQEVVYR